MSSTQPPDEPTPPPGEPTPAPPPPPPPPANPGMTPPPPPAGATPPMPGAPGAYGPGQPGNLLDRFLARLIDYIVVGIAVGIINFILQSALSYWTAVFISGVVGAVLITGYFAFFESNRGQTLGKQVMKLKTVGPDGQSNPTMNDAVKRNIYNAFGIVPCLGPLAQLVAIIMIAVNINSDPQRQHLFDRFAGGTKVMKIG